MQKSGPFGSFYAADSNAEGQGITTSNRQRRLGRQYLLAMALVMAALSYLHGDANRVERGGQKLSLQFWAYYKNMNSHSYYEASTHIHRFCDLAHRHAGSTSRRATRTAPRRMESDPDPVRRHVPVDGMAGTQGLR
jgi:hypothetical protein